MAAGGARAHSQGCQVAPLGLPKQSTHVLFVPPQMPIVANDCWITLKPMEKNRKSFLDYVPQ
jgi:hypothetical protein